MSGTKRLVVSLTILGHFIWNLLQTAVHVLAQLFQGIPTSGNQPTAAKSLSSIPGPWPSLPIIGTQWIFMWPGPYRRNQQHLIGEDYLRKYGPIVKEHHLWNFPVIHLYDRQDIQTVLKFPSKFPLRPGLEAQSAYRRSRPDRYNSVGLVNAQGPEWHALRTEMTTEMVNRKIVEHTIAKVSLIADELVDKLRSARRSDDGDRLYGFDDFIYQFMLEAILSIVLNQQLSSLKDQITPLTEKLLKATDRLFEVSDSPLWALLYGSYIDQLFDFEEAIYDVFAKIVHEALKETKPSREQLANAGILEHILAANADTRDKITTFIDLVLGGIESTGNAVLFLLFDILNDPTVRAGVYQELDLVLQPAADITTDTLVQLPYLKACLTESMRLHPVAPRLARILEKDMVLQNYNLPAGTLVVCETNVACLQEANYANARQFRPERWMNGSKISNAFLNLPFGVGRRMCPGKRIAEHEMMVLTAKVPS